MDGNGWSPGGVRYRLVIMLMIIFTRSAAPSPQQLTTRSASASNSSRVSSFLWKSKIKAAADQKLFAVICMWKTNFMRSDFPIEIPHFPPQKSHNSPYNFHISPPCFNSDSPFPQPAVHQGQRHTWLKYWAKIYTNRPNIPVRGCFLIRQNKQSHLAEINFKFSDQKKKIDLVGVKA